MVSIKTIKLKDVMDLINMRAFYFTHSESSNYQINDMENHMKELTKLRHDFTYQAIDLFYSRPFISVESYKDVLDEMEINLRNGVIK